ncbi:septum formation initiator family protein [Candidatus Nomurabacteria bacterium]|nr:septum formation initiator family protein [Candidatus Nomurabacteria bacterium]
MSSKLFQSKSALFVLLAIALFLAIGYTRAYYKNYLVKKEITRIEQEIESMEQKKLESLEILKYVMSDEFVEEKARSEMNMKKPGERVAFMTDYKEVGQQVEIKDDKLSNPKKWFRYFFHK